MSTYLLWVKILATSKQLWFAYPPLHRAVVRHAKAMTRNGAAVAAKLKPLVLAWDGTTEPPPSLVSLAHEFLVSVGMEQIVTQGAAP